MLFNTSVFDLQEDLPGAGQDRGQLSDLPGGREDLQSANRSCCTGRPPWCGTIRPSWPPSSCPTRRSSAPSPTGFRTSARWRQRYRLSNRLFRGIRVCDALGSYGITYIEDPDSPISGVLGRAAVVDTVRFPRTTLLIRSGDCDDTSALLGSLLESVGVGTAIMTSPGHVFLAFDTGEAEGESLAVHPSKPAGHRPPGNGLASGGNHGPRRGFPVGLGERLGADAQAPGEDRVPARAGAAGSLSRPCPFRLRIWPYSSPPEQEVERRVFPVHRRDGGTPSTGRASELWRKDCRGQRGIAAVRLRNQIGVLHARFGRDGEAETALLPLPVRRTGFHGGLSQSGQFETAPRGAGGSGPESPGPACSAIPIPPCSTFSWPCTTAAKASPIAPRPTWRRCAAAHRSSPGATAIWPIRPPLGPVQEPAGAQRKTNFH